MIRGEWDRRDRYYIVERREMNAAFLAGIPRGRDRYG
jgi:hypothetical protein